MVEITARNDTNSPFILYDADNEPVMFPAMGGVATGDFVMDQLQTLELFALAGGAVLNPSSGPANSSAPVLTGTARVGQVLTVTNGAWSGSPSPTFTRQWKRGATNIGTGALTYTLVAADAGQIITVQVTATNSEGVATATSNATAAVTAIPANTVIPVITGTAQVGETLTATNGTWTGSPAPTYARQWKAGGTNISGATATTYVPTEDDVGKTITVTVTATNAAGSASATSAATAAVIAA